MRKIFTLALFILVFYFVGLGQDKTANIQNISAAEKVKNLTKQRQDAEAELAALQVKYQDEYPRIKELKKKIALINDELSKLSPLAAMPTVGIAKEDAALFLEITTLRAQLRLCGLSDANEGCLSGDTKRRLAEAYQRAVSRPKVVTILLGDAIERFDGMRDGTRSAPQVSQIADEQNAELIRLLVAQNQRIIELLEKLVNKK